MTDFRDNLYIDKDHPILRGPLFVGRKGGPKKKARYLASPDSEDAVTWSVFRTLLRIASCRWLSRFVEDASGVAGTILDTEMTNMEIEYIKFWPHVPAPQSRLLWLLDHLDDPRISEKSKGACADRARPEPKRRLPRIRRRFPFYREKARTGCLVRGIGVLEGATELDALIEHPSFLVAVEAKYTADLHPFTTWDSERDQLGRVIDIAIELSLQQRKPSFAVLVTDQRSHDSPLLYEKLAPLYQTDRGFLREKLPHRTAEELDRLAGVGWITWREVLDGIDQQGLSGCERQLLCGLAAYLSVRRLY
jgi:hypothetical protein